MPRQIDKSKMMKELVTLNSRAIETSFRFELVSLERKSIEEKSTANNRKFLIFEGFRTTKRFSMQKIFMFERNSFKKKERLEIRLKV